MINDYDSLRQAVADWLARADLTATIPTFIQLAEQRISRDLKVSQMLTTTTGTASSGLVTLPTDFLSPVRVSVSIGGYDVALEPLPSDKAVNDRLGGVAYGYALEGNSIRIVGGSGSDAYTLTYYAKVPSLGSSVGGVNWLIEAAPDLYLYATLMESAPYLQDDARVQVWAAGYGAAKDSLQRVSDEARFSPAARAKPDFRVA